MVAPDESRRSAESRPLVAPARSRRGFSLRSLWAILAPHFAILARSRSLRENLAAPEPPRPTRRDTAERRDYFLAFFLVTFFLEVLFFLGAAVSSSPVSAPSIRKRW